MNSATKPVGGIVAVQIMRMANVPGVAVELVEERSTYTEQVCNDDGVLRIHHTLTLVVPRHQATALIPLLSEMTYDGISARITTTAGETLTVGWSDRFIFEQPLRLTSFSLESRARRADGNHAVILFESDDTTALQELT